MKVNEEGATWSDNFAVVGRLYAYRSPDSDAIASQIVQEQWKSWRHEHLRNVTLSDVGSPGHVNPPFPTQAFAARTLANPKFAQAERGYWKIFAIPFGEVSHVIMQQSATSQGLFLRLAKEMGPRLRDRVASPSLWITHRTLPRWQFTFITRLVLRGHRNFPLSFLCICTIRSTYFS